MNGLNGGLASSRHRRDGCTGVGYAYHLDASGTVVSPSVPVLRQDESHELKEV